MTHEEYLEMLKGLFQLEIDTHIELIDFLLEDLDNSEDQ